MYGIPSAVRYVYRGCLYLVDWNGGMEWWNEMVDDHARRSRSVTTYTHCVRVMPSQLC